MGQFQSNLAQIIILVFEMKDFFPRGYKYEKVKNTLMILKIFPSTTGPISIKHGTNHHWKKGILDYSNKGPSRFLGEMLTE